MSRSNASMVMSVDDLAIKTKQPEFKENVDYMGNSLTLDNNYNLYQCWKQTNSTSSKNTKDDISNIIPSSISKRLENVCWRRWSKNLYKLDVASPHYINWLKDEDITWLYGPMFVGNTDFGISDGATLTESNLQKMKIYSTKDVADARDDESLTSTIPSDASSLSFSSSDSECDVFDNYDYPEYSWELKSALRRKGPTKSARKNVKFNYIVNSREFINDMSIDYDFLDEQCL